MYNVNTNLQIDDRRRINEEKKYETLRYLSRRYTGTLCTIIESTLVNQKLYQNKNLKINSISTYICMVFLSGRIHTKLLTVVSSRRK